MVTLKWSLVFDKMTSLLQGCAVTMEISVLTLIFGTILGVMLALMRDSHIKVVSRLAQLYIWIWRGTPLMVQAFLIYFGLPNLGITFSAMTAGVLSMSLNTGAYIAEIVRSGIHARGREKQPKHLECPGIWKCFELWHHRQPRSAFFPL